VSPLASLNGHEAVRASLAAAALRGTLPTALLFIGPPGTGKQRTALWLAQMLLCEAPAADGPCGTCRPCHLALRLEHPDIHWFFPLPRPRVSGGPERLGEALEEARAIELEARRSGSWATTRPDEPVGIYLAHAQVIRRVAGTRPAMARCKVIVIGDAELLVPQEASPEAANALLKLFEEPPADTTLITTASDPDALLPTVRSRLLPVRFGRLPEDAVRDHLVAVHGVDPEHAALAARLSEGSIGHAAGYLPVDGQPGPLDSLRLEARTILEAVFHGGAEAYALALARAPAGARGDFSTILEFAARWLRDLAAVAAGAHESVINVDATGWLERHARGFADGRVIAGAISDIDATLGLTVFNINPQLALRDLMRRLSDRLALQPAEST